jgi:hypothetical protein
LSPASPCYREKERAVAAIGPIEHNEERLIDPGDGGLVHVGRRVHAKQSGVLNDRAAVRPIIFRHTNGLSST